jgi:hypothetical protein
MVAIPGLKELESRKRDLVLESEVNRQLLHLEVTKIRLSFARLRSSFTGGRGLWKWLAPVAGFVVARRFSGGSGVMAKGSMLISLLGSVWKLWNAMKKRGPVDAPEV